MPSWHAGTTLPSPLPFSYVMQLKLMTISLRELIKITLHMANISLVTWGLTQISTGSSVTTASK
jgi:hypothetical protein